MGKVVVLGSINQDVIAACEKHPSRGEIVPGFGLFRAPGGKGANQAVAAALANAESVIIGAVGADTAGSESIDFLAASKVDVSNVRHIEGMSTGTASIFVDLEGEISIVVIAGANARATDDPSVRFDSSDVLVSPLEVPAPAIHSFFQRGKERGCTTILNASPFPSIPEGLAQLVDICVVNESELAALAEVDSETFTSTEVIVAAARCIRLAEESTVVVMLETRGAIAVQGSRHMSIESGRPNVVDITGVADCFVGSLAALLTEDETLETAMRYANRAAAIVATRRGALMPSRHEVEANLTAAT